MQPTGPDKPPAPVHGKDLRTKQVLLIDGSTTARYALRLRLQSLGIQVHQAYSVEAALPALRAGRPDLIIAAAVLPGVNALELHELLPSIADPPPLMVRRRSADWPLARVASARGLVVVSADDELLRLLPRLLTAPPRKRQAALPGPAQSLRAVPEPSVADPTWHPSALPAEDATGRPDNTRPISPNLALPAMLTGLLIGALLGAWTVWLLA